MSIYNLVIWKMFLAKGTYHDWCKKTATFGEFIHK